MKTVKTFLFIFCFINTGNAQPYFDLINTRYLNSPDKGIWRQKNEEIKMKYYNFSATVPLQFKNKDAIILSPYYEQWELKSYFKFKTGSWVLPVSYLKNFKNSKWSLLTTFIARSNKESAFNSGYHFDKGFYQFGGAVITSYKKDSSLTFKFGLYYNKEFFGNFFITLAGIDWKINNKNNLFGVLPGNLTFEHRVTKWFYYGAVFRAYTNSYRLFINDPCFSDCTLKGSFRIDDNQLASFADFYLTKKIVINAELGHSVLRKISFVTIGEQIGKSSSPLSKKDNLFFKIALAYRLRFR